MLGWYKIINMESMTIILISAIAFLLVIMAIGLSVANFSGAAMYDTYMDYSKQRTKAGMRGIDFAMAVNHEHFNDRLKISIIKEFMQDHYQIGTMGVAISEGNASSESVAAVTVVAHELGHAMQDYKTKGRFKRFLFLGKLGRAVGFLMFPALIAGIVLMFFEAYSSYGIIALGVAAGLFLFSLFLKIYIITIEKEASKIGLKFLEPALTDDELRAAKKLLKAAKLTYWGEFFGVLLSWTFLTKKTKYF